MSHDPHHVYREPDAWGENPYAAPMAPLAEEPAFKRVGHAEPSASRWLRLSGVLIDGLLFVLVAAAVGIPTALILRNEMDKPDSPAPAIVGGVVLLAMLLFQAVQWWLISTTGQSIGKKVVGTRIVMAENGLLPGFVHGVLVRSWVTTLIYFVPLIGPLFRIVNYCFIFGDERRCLHDHMAQTRVVSATPTAGPFTGFKGAEDF